MVVDNSEDSNAQHSETDGPKEQEEKPTDMQEKDGEFNFAISNIVTTSETDDGGDKDRDMDVDASVGVC
jgi:hypothetical protein